VLCGSRIYFHRERFAAESWARSSTITTSFLQRYFQVPAIDFQQVLESNLELGERLKPLVADVTGMLEQLSLDGRNVLFEGAQGAIVWDVGPGYVSLRDVVHDHGRRSIARYQVWGPRRLHEVLGNRQGLCPPASVAGPFPTELVRRVRRISVAGG